MPYIKAPKQPEGHVGRTYFEATYRHADGVNWCAIVEDVQPGETVLTQAEFEALRDATYDANIEYEQTQLRKRRAEIEAAPEVHPVIKALRLRQIERATLDALDKGITEAEAVAQHEAAIAELRTTLTPEEKAALLHECDTALADIIGGDLCAEVCEHRGLPVGSKGTDWREVKRAKPDHDTILRNAAINEFVQIGVSMMNEADAKA